MKWAKGTTATSTVVDRYGYTYDRNGNRLTRSNALAAAFSETYSYDALNQLQSFNRTSGTTTSQQWQFDALGNWTTVTTNGMDQTRTANAQNELTQVGSASLAYSTTGNLTTDAQGRTLVYDAWNRLVSVSNAAGTQVARYEYDGLNHRIVEQAGTLATPAAASAAVRDLFYSLNWQVLEERVRDAAGAIPAVADTRYVWSPVYVDALIARDRNTDGNITTGTGGLEERVYALQDANWNTTALVAATGISGLTLGNVFTRFVYTPYGESQTLTASWGTPAAGSAPITPWSHLFQGLKLTDVTGLAYVRHRDYSPTLGRFIERDPIGFEAGDNNWYRFVANGPAGDTDPSGLTGRGMPEGTEAGDLEILQHERLGPWRANGWSVAVALLEHFLDKNADKTHPFDVSGSPGARNITESATVLRFLKNFLATQARDKTGVVKFENQFVAHPKWWQTKGEVLYAFGGFNLFITGTLTIIENERSLGCKGWSFDGKAKIQDKYTFDPTDWPRMEFRSYRAARDLEKNHKGYEPFDVVLNWDYSASGCVDLEPPPPAGHGRHML